MEHMTRALVDWIEIPSVTGGEADYADALSRALAAEGFDAELQEVEPGRANLLARAGSPRVVFCTHLDTVPPFFGSRTADGFVFGRGSCDAKGQAVAMLEAGRRLLKAGVTDFGFLFTVGEEVDSIGAAFADRHLADPWRPEHVVIGEPTDNTYVAGHKGIYKAKLCAHGVRGHSSQDVGPSAVHELVASLQALIASEWGDHALFGKGTLNVGQVKGGVAANVVAGEAEAEVLIRTVEEPAAVERRLRSLLGPHVELEAQYKAYAPVPFHVPGGAPSKVVAFGTDAPHMPSWGTPVLFGPGSILDAHTADEKVAVDDLAAAALEYERLVTRLLANAPAAR